MARSTDSRPASVSCHGGAKRSHSDMQASAPGAPGAALGASSDNITAQEARDARDRALALRVESRDDGRERSASAQRGGLCEAAHARAPLAHARVHDARERVAGHDATREAVREAREREGVEQREQRTCTIWGRGGVAGSEQRSRDIRDK